MSTPLSVNFEELFLFRLSPDNHERILTMIELAAQLAQLAGNQECIKIDAQDSAWQLAKALQATIRLRRPDRLACFPADR